MLKIDQTYWKNLADSARKIFKVCLTIFQHYTGRSYPIWNISDDDVIFSKNSNGAFLVKTRRKSVLL